MHWRTDHAMHCLYQIWLSMCVSFCLFALFCFLRPFILRVLFLPPCFPFLLSSFICPTSGLKALGWMRTSVCVCMCTVQRVSSCVTLHCWEATGSLTAVWIWTGRVTACKHPSFFFDLLLYTSLSFSLSFIHTNRHQLTEIKWPTSPINRRCVGSNDISCSFGGCTHALATQ